MLCLIFIIIPTLSLQVVQSLFYNDSNTQVRHGSCKFRSVRQAEFHWNSPEKSMTESFVLDNVEYKLCKYQVTWDEALVFCSSHRAHLATLDSEEKTAFIVQAIASISSVSEEYWIGARKMYEDPWKWNSNEMTLSSEGDIMSKVTIWYPGFEPNNIHCLTIDRSGHNEPVFVPRACTQKRGFICQRDNYRTFDNKIRMVAATRIDEQEFRLYAGRATWPEAVVQCRQEGLQIGQVNTVEEARVLAISMLRNRPEGIESMWIGGYRKNDDENTWRWLASGEKIENNGLWRKDLSESSGGCLLLDRHVCETPIYVESTCDRKRDVLCQKPPKKLLSKTPMPVVVNGCPYWVGFQPLKWSDARRVCESFNASLVVLDSVATISHMMGLMLDNKSELRHIWTNGRRSKTGGQWMWDVTGESIPDLGKSFIPWCPDDDYYRNENSCLNLDRENLDSPLVYGLSCREKQTYVCQPYAGDCVFHSTPKLPLDTVINASEDIEEETTFEYPRIFDKYLATLTMSTITTPFSIVKLNDDVIQTTLHSQNNDLDEFITWKPNESISETNSSSQRNFAQYLKPFTRFTLPTLPQFGIKVVSAGEATTNLPGIEMKKKKNKAYKLLTTSSHNSAATHLPPSSSFSTSIKKGSSDVRKASKDQRKMYDLSDSHETTISSISTESTIEKSSKIVNKTSRPAFTQISPSLKSFLGSKNSSKSSKASKTSTTSSLIVSDDSSGRSSTDFARTKKYSMKTTRDINLSNTATTNPSDVPNATDEQKITSNLKAIENSPSKPVDSFVVKKPRPNSTLMARRKQNFRVTTEASTPYDAIDMDYYNDDKNDKTTKKSVEGNAKTAEEFNEYSEDYETTSSAKLLTKKKLKHTSTLSLRKNLPPSTKSEEEEEEEEDKEENSEEDEDAMKSSLPIAAELSKNLESALVTMMKNGLEKKNREKSGESLNTMKIDTESNEENAPWAREKSGNDGDGIRSANAENISLRPYYSFEGPMIADLPDEIIPEEFQREFKFIGRKLTPESFHVLKSIRSESLKEARKSPNNETRRHINSQQSNPQSPVSNFPISMMGMPPIHPNDPNSMMQLGRYFKNQFGGLQHMSNRDVGNSRQPMTNPTGEIGVNDQRRFRPGSGRPFLQERLGGYPVNREQDIRKKGQQWEKSKRPGLREPDTNYYGGGRRLYPRGNYDIYGSLHQQEGRNNEERLRNDREKLDVTWPDEYVVNYDNFDQPSESVSPRSSPVPIRTTRSFHEEIRVRKVEAIKQKPLPDFKLSKLVKEVKIDLDQRMLRRYLEGFAKKIGRRNSGAKDDDWKDTWRQLLKQMLSVMDRMNINVNGDLMKLRVGSDDRNNKLRVSLGNSKELGWKSELKKERKDSPSGNYANVVKKISENLRKNAEVENQQKSMQASLNSLQIKNSVKINAKHQIKVETTDSYNTIPDNRDSTTGNPLEEEKIKVTTFPGPQINYDKFGDKLSEHRQERTDKPIVDHRENSHQMSNVLHPKYTKFNNTQSVRKQESIPVARLSTVFGYRQLMPQLHHRIIFQPGWGQIRAKSGSQKTVLQGEYLPKGTLSKIVNSENKNEHFEGKKNEAEKPKHNFLASTSSTAKPDESNLEKSLKNSFEKKTEPKSVNDRKINEEKSNFPSKVSTMDDISKNHSDVQNKSNNTDNQRDKISGTDNNTNEAWRDVAEEIGKNKLRNENLDGYYNATYVEESTDRKIDDDDDKEGSRRDMEEEIVDEETESPEDYNQKPIWTNPAHRLHKAMELSVLRKFGANSLNSFRSKNLVTRSVKEIEAIRQVKSPEPPSRNRHYNQGQKIEENLENLKGEPSVISLRMIMDPERKTSRIFRQLQQDPQISEKTPPTVELRVQFTGKEEARKSVKEEISSRNHLKLNEKENKTLHDSVISQLGEDVKNENSKSLVAPIRIIVDKERRRAKLNKLRERSRNFKRNYLRAAAAAMRRQNETAISDFRNRKYRNIGLGTKNAFPSDVKAAKDIPNVQHYMATSLRNFDEKNLTNSGENVWKKAAKSYPKDMGIDWTEQASALFADLKESRDDLTLYIDLTLGRVGSKPRIGGRSKG